MYVRELKRLLENENDNNIVTIYDIDNGKRTTELSIDVSITGFFEINVATD